MAPSLAQVLFGGAAVYVCYSLFSFYQLFYPAACLDDERQTCLKLYDGAVRLRLYGSDSPRASFEQLQLIYSSPNSKDWQQLPFQKSVDVRLPASVRLRNGSYFLYAFLNRAGVDAHDIEDAIVAVAPLTQHRMLAPKAFQLLGQPEETAASSAVGQVVPHWRSSFTVNVMTTAVSLDAAAVPSELSHLIRQPVRARFLPLLFLNTLKFRAAQLQPVNRSAAVVRLNLDYQPVHLGALRLMLTLSGSLDQLRQLGFPDKDIEEVQGLFTDSGFLLLGTTVVVTVLHLVLDLLSFKNDVSFWRRVDDTTGLSARVVGWRCISGVVILLYLVEESASLLVLVPSGFGLVIEFWKYLRLRKLRNVEGAGQASAVGTSAIAPKGSAEALATEQFDSQGMRYLMIGLAPLLVAGAVYSLLYLPQRSWYSWTVHCAANGVYAFGFLFMLPQLFINYKLRSVAHLPWKALTYKAFNTFIDDFFAFIITMPTAHRLACFRDDIIFIIYCYQRWLYPVDHERKAEAHGTDVDLETKKQN